MKRKTLIIVIGWGIAIVSGGLAFLFGHHLQAILHDPIDIIALVMLMAVGLGVGLAVGASNMHE